MRKHLLSIILSFVFLLSSCGYSENDNLQSFQPTEAAVTNSPIPENTPSPIPVNKPIERSKLNIADIPAYSGSPYVMVNNNIPSFTDEDMTTEPFEIYSPLDSLGRCGVAYANICKELMPTEERQGIGQVKPAGWHTVRYEEVGAGSEGYLYNRCYLIGFQFVFLNIFHCSKVNVITCHCILNCGF
ncbi:MAG: DNA/RNA non-specific endonuclease [Clostridia bacterium]|nr:DNA/RNA non-specific endonuclease [Clostridia bacterium]MBQ3461601.1 DNA/RNA non-specific endonuclease [Clostridia bacterium]